MIYLDTDFAIYLVESVHAFGDAARRVVEQHPGETLCLSSLVAMECLIKPFRNGDIALEESFRQFFASSMMVPLTAEVYERAARLRAARPALRTPDALHWAAALVAGCTAVWTGDAGFARLGAPYVCDVITSV